MKTFAGRRIRNGTILVIAAALVAGTVTVLQTALVRTVFLTGWSLAALILLLAAYNGIKKLPFLPLGSSAAWLQLHIYCGLLTMVVFILHIDFRVPNGLFDTSLAVFYFLVFFSGLVGLAMTRSFPPRLSARGEEVIFERIPVFIRRLRNEVEELVFGCVSETETTAVPDFYLEYLKPFFERPRHFWSHLFHSERPRRMLLLTIEEQYPFLNDIERDAMRKISEKVAIKDGLDHQHALQGTLKCWLFFHVPLTYGLLILILFHTILVHAFAGAS